MNRLLLPAVVLSCMFASCDNTSKEECLVVPEPKEITVELAIHQLQDSIANLPGKKELVDLFTRHPLVRDFVFRRTEYPDDSVFINEIYKRLSNPGIDTLLSETKRVFGDLTPLRREFEAAFRNIKYYYPDYVPPKIQTVISGLDTDMLVTDSLIIVGLDFYLGRDGRFRPKMYDYLLRRYEPEDIVPSVMLIYGINDNLNKTDVNDKTVLADMIAYGKSYYFAKRMLPCVPDSILMSYSTEEIQGSRNNQDLIWARLIENQVLYSTSHVVKKDYLGDRPFTIQVGEKCPGRIGQWIGWQIVEKYMETHPEITLPELMKTADAQKIFKESRYKPERR
jgi:gliding motility-associated lipoprotein GldB